MSEVINTNVKFLDDYVMPERIKSALQDIIDYPDLSPKVMCLYGYAGNGKTSFAKYWASQNTADVAYYPMNELKNKEVEEIDISSINLMGFVDEQRPIFNRITILDEFHNLTPKEQDLFKTKIDDMNEQCRLIICLNIEEKKPLKKQMTEPMRSRSHCIDFNASIYDMDELVTQCLELYSYLDEGYVRSVFPDYRKLKETNEYKKRLEAVKTAQ